MLTPQLLAQLSNEEILAAAHTESDSLTSTPLEIELLKRFADAIDAAADAQKLIDVMDEYDLTSDDIRAFGDALFLSPKHTIALLDFIADEGINDPADLKAAFDLANKFHALANDAGDVFTRLSELSTTTQE